MKLDELEAAVEAILFTMGEAVEVERIAEAVNQDVDTVRRVIRSMMDRYEQSNRGIRILELDGAFQLGTKPELYETIIRITHIPKKNILTDVLLETLTIIAYKQPITKAEIEQIRGVKCDHAVNKLVEYNLVGEVGRLNAPGRPIQFGTTEEFLRSFGISNLEDLPEPEPDMVESFKQEAEEEIQLSLPL